MCRLLSRLPMRVAVAGTFGPLHDGHRTLLEHALRFGEDGVVVALTSDELAVETRHDSRPIPSFEERTRAVTDAIGEIDEWDRDIEIRTLETEYGIATDEPSIDALVVSPRRPPNSRRSTDCGARGSNRCRGSSHRTSTPTTATGSRRPGSSRGDRRTRTRPRVPAWQSIATVRPESLIPTICHTVRPPVSQ